MAKTKATQQSAVATKKGLRGMMANMRKGRGVSLDFFRRNGWFICFLIVVVLILLGMRDRTRIYAPDKGFAHRAETGRERAH